MEDGPLPGRGGEIVLLVRVRDKGVVRGHHSNVEMNEVTEERRLVGTRVASGKPVIPVALDVPVGVHVPGVVGLGAGDFDLLETPLGKVDIASAEVTAKIRVLQTERSSQGPDLGIVASGSVIDDLDLPVVLGIADGHVSVG